MQLPISLGNQGFASLRENHCFYIDKTDFIREWWEEQDVVTLIKYEKRYQTSSDHSVSFLRYNILVISERSSKITSGFTSLVFTSSLVLSPLSTKIDVTSL